MTLRSMVDMKEGWQAERKWGQRVWHYITKGDGGFSLCRRLGFYVGDVVPAVNGTPRGNEDCAECFRKLQTRFKKGLVKP